MGTEDATPATPSHRDTAILRSAYGAFAVGDVLRFLTYCSDDFVFRVPGHNRMTGTYRGHDEFLGLVEVLLTLAGGTRAHDVLEVRAVGDRGTVRLVHRVERSGSTTLVPVTHICLLRDGKLVEIEERPDDLRAYDAAWT
jgi:ketosteroid isomerase-like protein